MNSLVTIPPSSLAEHASKAQGIIEIGRNSNKSSRWSGGKGRRRTRSQTESFKLEERASPFRIEIGKPRNEFIESRLNPSPSREPTKKTHEFKREPNNLTNPDTNHTKSSVPSPSLQSYQNSYYKSLNSCQNKYYQTVQKKKPKDTSGMTKIVLSPSRRPRPPPRLVGNSKPSSRTIHTDLAHCQRKEDDHSDMHTLLTSSETATVRCDDESSFWVGTSNASHCHDCNHVFVEEYEEGIQNGMNRTSNSESFESSSHNADTLGNSHSYSSSGPIWSSHELNLFHNEECQDYDSIASDRVAVERGHGIKNHDENNKTNPQIPENISFYSAGSQYLSLRDLLPPRDEMTNDANATSFEGNNCERIHLQNDFPEEESPYQQASTEEDGGDITTSKELFLKKRNAIDECKCTIM